MVWKKDPREAYITSIEKVIKATSQMSHYSISETFCQTKEGRSAYWIRLLSLYDEKQHDAPLSALFAPKFCDKKKRHIFDDLDFPLLPLIQFHALQCLKKRPIHNFAKLTEIDREKIKLKFNLYFLNHFLRYVSLKIHDQKKEEGLSAEREYEHLKNLKDR